jgi:3-hydroxymyristoyl/3-hydroxydecanoyl-(acyl carrier protein) dehydratase
MSLSVLNGLPKVLGRESGEEELFVLALGPEDLCFQGHFPGNPIVPGVIQVDWAIRFGQQVFGPLGDFQGIMKLKFLDLILPGERLELYLTFDRAAGRLGFRYLAQGGRKSVGIVLFSHT